MSKPPVPETGKPVLVNPQDFVPAPMMPINPGCVPPDSQCVAYLAHDLEATIGLTDPHQLAFAITTPKMQTLELWIEIAAGDCTHPVFMTKGQKFPVHTGKNTLVGLDDIAADAAKPYFVSGNTITLAVQPKAAGVTVGVGKIVIHGGKKADPPHRSR